MLPSLYTFIQVLAMTGNIKQLKEILKSTRETTHSLCSLQNSSLSTLRTLLIKCTNLLRMLKIESFFIASLLPREIINRHLFHKTQVEEKGFVNYGFKFSSLRRRTVCE